MVGSRVAGNGFGKGNGERSFLDMETEETVETVETVHRFQEQIQPSMNVSHHNEICL